MQTRKIHVAGVFIILWGIAAGCMADSWLLPTRETFYSKNRRFAVTIVPKQLEGQLESFEDKAEGRADAGAAEGVPNNRPRALFYSVGPNDQLSLMTEIQLVNEVAPVTALVSEDGQYLVTFDNWHSVGHGNNVVVIYSTRGPLVRSLSLEDILTSRDIAALPQTVSSILWGAGHFIDESNSTLVLQIERCAGRENCLEKPPQVVLRLADGTPLQPARDLLPRPKPAVR